MHNVSKHENKLQIEIHNGNAVIWHEELNEKVKDRTVVG